MRKGRRILWVWASLGEQGFVQTGLVAEVVADSGQVHAGLARQCTHRGLLETLFGKQLEPGSQQPLAGIDAIATDRLMGRRGKGRGCQTRVLIRTVVGFNTSV